MSLPIALQELRIPVIGAPTEVIAKIRARIGTRILAAPGLGHGVVAARRRLRSN